MIFNRLHTYYILCQVHLYVCVIKDESKLGYVLSYLRIYLLDKTCFQRKECDSSNYGKRSRTVLPAFTTSVKFITTASERQCARSKSQTILHFSSNHFDYTLSATAILFFLLAIYDQSIKKEVRESHKKVHQFAGYTTALDLQLCMYSGSGN